jgi:hypothetical protein
MLGSMEDERNFCNLAFMKSKLCNQMATHLDLCVHMFTQYFYNVINFSDNVAIATRMKYALGTRQIGSFELATCIS